MTTVLAAGDSFVYGSELASPANTFTALLGADECVAWPGFGNDAIARTAIERCEQGGVDGVIVSWTFPGRYAPILRSKTPDPFCCIFIK